MNQTKMKKLLTLVLAFFGGAVLAAAFMRAKKATDAKATVPGSTGPTLGANVVAEIKSVTQTS